MHGNTTSLSCGSRYYCNVVPDDLVSPRSYRVALPRSCGRQQLESDSRIPRLLTDQRYPSNLQCPWSFCTCEAFRLASWTNPAAELEQHPGLAQARVVANSSVLSRRSYLIQDRKLITIARSRSKVAKRKPRMMHKKVVDMHQVH
jgi:hypothetical protein